MPGGLSRGGRLDSLENLGQLELLEMLGILETLVFLDNLGSPHDFMALAEGGKHCNLSPQRRWHRRLVAFDATLSDYRPQCATSICAFRH